jgi:hypothetical protein
MCLSWLRVNCVGGRAMILWIRTEQQNCFGGILHKRPPEYSGESVPPSSGWIFHKSFGKSAMRVVASSG